MAQLVLTGQLSAQEFFQRFLQNYQVMPEETSRRDSGSKESLVATQLGRTGLWGLCSGEETVVGGNMS